MAPEKNYIPLSYIKSYHIKERDLYARMVISLRMDLTRSMYIIAFWLWQEENGQKNIIQKLLGLDDLNLLEVARAADVFIEAICSEPQPDQPNQGFRNQVLQGMEYYFNTVCQKSFEDIRKRAEEEARLHRMKLLIDHMSGININNHTTSTIISTFKTIGDGSFNSKSFSVKHMIDYQNYVPHIEGMSMYRESKSEFQSTLQTVEFPFNVMVRDDLVVPRFIYPWMVGKNINNRIGTNSGSSDPKQSNIPPEERTLFVTFSNGYPLSEDETYSFFMRYYGDVELVNIKPTEDGKPPLFALVVFYSLSTVLRVLDGNLKKKFVTNGKHLWARRFYPKKK